VRTRKCGDDGCLTNAQKIVGNRTSRTLFVREINTEDAPILTGRGNSQVYLARAQRELSLWVYDSMTDRERWKATNRFVIRLQEPRSLVGGMTTEIYLFR
jgi:hypothetical protein